MQPFLRERRFAFPHPDLADVKLEPITQPLYSAAVYDNAALAPQRELFFYRYAIGGQVSGLPAAAGTVPATILHTNMETAGFIASPKVFLVKGVRIVIPGIDSAFTGLKDDSAYEAEVVAALSIDDVLEILYGTYFRFFVGTKNYLVCPTWAVPGNTGVSGLAETDIMAQAGGGPFIAQMLSHNTAGKYFGMGDNPILIPAQQNFFCSLNASQATPPTMAVERVVVCVLDGILGREVQ